MGIVQAREREADIVLGTDPDSDRVGIAARTAEGDYRLMTGNQIGALLMNFILNQISIHIPPLLRTWSPRNWVLRFRKSTELLFSPL